MQALKITLLVCLTVFCLALGIDRALAADSTHRVYLKSIEISPAKSDGKSWDVDDGKPDLVISMKNLSDNTQKEVVTEEKADVLSATYDSATVMVGAGQKLRILVEDKDLAANDTIGTTTLDITEDMLKKGTHTFKFGQVKALTIEFRKP